jgi:hypothetical protein
MVLLWHVFQQKTPEENSSDLGHTLRIDYNQYDFALFSHL